MRNDVWTIETDTVLEAQGCVNCGILFALPQDLRTQRQSDGHSFYCPNGHSQSYTTTDAMRLREEREKSTRLIADLDQAEGQIGQLASDVMDKAKEIRRMKRRAKAGVCQWCRRHFANVEHHVASKHPGQSPSTGKATGDGN